MNLYKKCRGCGAEKSDWVKLENYKALASLGFNVGPRRGI